jgi:hypothetical protein
MYVLEECSGKVQRHMTAGFVVRMKVLVALHMVAGPARGKVCAKKIGRLYSGHVLDGGLM